MGLPTVTFPSSPASFPLGHWIAFGLPPNIISYAATMFLLKTKRLSPLKGPF
jgi:hypothetical protein